MRIRITILVEKGDYLMYPNVHKGVVKLFIAEILIILTAVFGIVTAVAIIAVVVLIVTLVVSIAAFVLHLLGLQQAGREDVYFRVAFFLVLATILFTIVATVLRTIFPALVLLYTILEAVCDVLQVAVMVYTVFGINNIATELGKEKLANMGRIIIYLVIGLFFFTIVLRILGSVFAGFPALVLVFTVLAIVGAVIELITYVIYFFFLGRAAKEIK